MTVWEKFTHICRINTSDTDGILDNENCYISAKLDGTNSSIFFNGQEFVCGSRNRILKESKDNAGFWKWCHSDDVEAKRLRDFCKNHTNCIVYGEWMGTSKFVGSIKSYNPEALGKMWIFDVYDYDDERYLGDDEWRSLLGNYDLDEWFVKLFGVYNHPCMETLRTIADNNKFLLDNSSTIGEGIVIKVPGWKNCYDRPCYAKFVREDFKVNKAKPVKQTYAPGEIEQMIVGEYLTDSELTKNMSKTCTWANVDEFDKKNSKMIGFFINLCFNESILEETKDWVKKYKNPTVDFKKLATFSAIKARNYLGF